MGDTEVLSPVGEMGCFLINLLLPTSVCHLFEDYLGGCVFTLGQLMGAKGCTLAKKLAREKSYMIIVGEGESAIINENPPNQVPYPHIWTIIPC